MNNNKETPNYKRYDFNVDNPNQRNQRSNFRGWWFALVILLIALTIGLGISWLKDSGGSTKSSINNDPITKTVKGKLSEQVQNQRVANFQDKLNEMDNNGITTSQRKQLQGLINKESNSSVKKREQALLNDAQTKQVAKPQPKKVAPKQPAPAENNQFSSTHTFASIPDAKNWADATKDQWLKAGYTNYTITANGQGYFTLTFTK